MRYGRSNVDGASRLLDLEIFAVRYKCRFRELLSLLVAGEVMALMIGRPAVVLTRQLDVGLRDDLNVSLRTLNLQL